MEADVIIKFVALVEHSKHVIGHELVNNVYYRTFDYNIQCVERLKPQSVIHSGSLYHFWNQVKLNNNLTQKSYRHSKLE